jgi:plastocyanin
MSRKKRIRIAGLALALTAVFVTSASASASKTITIRHQMRGCHTWSFASGPYKASLQFRVVHGTSVVFVNNDIMSHKLVQTAGPTARVINAKMNRIGAKASVKLTHRGVYRFITKPGEDYPKFGEMKTIGEDNVLRLVITVT